MKKFMFRLYGYILQHGPNFARRPMKYIYRTFFFEHRERKLHLGNLNPDKTFYVIRNVTEAQGLLNNYIEVLRKIQYAFEKGYIPIVDFLHYYRPGMQDEAFAYKENSWEYYFKQPQEEYSLEEVYESRNVVLSYGIDIMDNENWPKYTSESYDVKQYHELYTKYAQINSNIMDMVDKSYEELFKGKGKILGVAFRRELERGVALGIPLYTEALCHHPKMSLAQLKEKINEHMSTDDFDAFFLAGDDRETINIFRAEYGDKCIIFERMLPHYFKNGKPIVRREDVLVEYNSKDNLQAIKSKEYLIESVLLSRCNSILGIETSVCACARIINGDSYEMRFD